jgi:hypothetical protein
MMFGESSFTQITRFFFFMFQFIFESDFLIFLAHRKPHALQRLGSRKVYRGWR